MNFDENKLESGSYFYEPAHSVVSITELLHEHNFPLVL